MRVAGVLGQHPEEVVLVLEVPVEAAVADPGRLDDVVDAGVVVAAGGEHLGAGLEQRLPGLLAAGPQGAVGRRRPARASRRPPGAAGRPAAADDVDAVDRAGEQAVDELGQTPSTSGWRLMPLGRLLGVEAAADEHGDHAGGEPLCCGASRGSTPKARSRAAPGAVADVARARASWPSWSRLAAWNAANTGAYASWRAMNSSIQPVRWATPAASGVTGSSCSASATISLAELAGQRPEDVVLAGEVLVERGPRAAGLLGDQLDPGLVEPGPREHLEGGAEDAALGVGAPLAHERVAAERRPPHDAGVHPGRSQSSG